MVGEDVIDTTETDIEVFDNCQRVVSLLIPALETYGNRLMETKRLDVNPVI